MFGLLHAKSGRKDFLPKSKEMEFISAEPSREDWDIVENLAGKYGIKLVIIFTNTSVNI